MRALRAAACLMLRLDLLGIFRSRRWWVPLVIAVGLVPLELGWYGLLRALYVLFAARNDGRMVLVLGVTAGMLTALLFGSAYLLSAIFYGRDLAFLLALPLRRWQVVLAKLLPVVMNEYLTLLFVAGPAFAVYGAGAVAGPAYWAALPLVFVALPLVPLAVATMVILALDRLAGVHRESVRTLSGLGVATLVLAIQAMVRQTQELRLDAPAVAPLLAGYRAWAAALDRWFPFPGWAARGLTGHPGYLLAFLGTSGIAAVAAVVLAGRSLETLTAAHRSRTVGGDVWRERGRLRAMAFREAAIHLRTPVFLTSSLLGTVLLPAVLAFSILRGHPVEGAVPQRLQILAGLGAVGLSVLAAASAGLGATALSREGRSFWLSRLLPVPAREQCLAKLGYAWSWSLVGVGLAVGAVSLLARLPWGVVLPCAGTAALAVLVVAQIGLLVDLYRPRLDWEEPRQAAKGNPNVLLAMLATAAVLFPGGLGGALADLAGLAPWKIWIGLGLYMGLLSVGGWLLLRGLAEGAYRRIERF
ncbi:MAG: hypothetical protein M0031_10310 [Thermaerobacter sp.]|jgi:ABC-2 type transport system permease protein|nr:hypothetical protein [Thermaerobacter sp.]